MMDGSPDHEVRRGPADLRTVREQFQVGGLHVFATEDQAMLEKHVLAHFVTLGACLDAVDELLAAG